MGILVCLTIAIAVLADLFFLPALFFRLKPNLDKVGRSEQIQSIRPQASPSHDPKSTTEPSILEESRPE
jgi:hypothetical protein